MWLSLWLGAVHGGPSNSEAQLFRRKNLAPNWNTLERKNHWNFTPPKRTGLMKKTRGGKNSRNTQLVMHLRLQNSSKKIVFFLIWPSLVVLNHSSPMPMGINYTRSIISTYYLSKFFSRRFCSVWTLVNNRSFCRITWRKTFGRKAKISLLNRNK